MVVFAYGNCVSAGRIHMCQRKPIEETEQMFLVAWFSVAWPEAAPFLIHCPNGGKRPINVARRLKKMGAKAGVSDLFLAMPKAGFAGLWLEYKPAPPARGALSASQAWWLEKMRENGYQAVCVRGPLEFSDQVTRYLACPPKISVSTYYLRQAACRPKSFPHWLAPLFASDTCAA